MNDIELEDKFEDKLRALCIAYDAKNHAYPESEYEGAALFEFYLDKAIYLRSRQRLIKSIANTFTFKQFSDILDKYSNCVPRRERIKLLSTYDPCNPYILQLRILELLVPIAED